jgi:hypothetical protein
MSQLFLGMVFISKYLGQLDAPPKPISRRRRTDDDELEQQARKGRLPSVYLGAAAKSSRMPIENGFRIVKFVRL